MVRNTPTKHHNPTNPSQPHHQPQPQPQRFRPFDYLREPPTAHRLHRPPNIQPLQPPTHFRSLANSTPGSLPFAPFTPGMAHLKYTPGQILFVKNVPTEYAPHVTTLFGTFNPLEMKNLYPFSSITTLMIALPSKDAAEEALQRTDEMKVGTALISVERYSAKQSVVARREGRRRGEGFVGGGLGAVEEEREEGEEEGKVNWPVLGEGKEVDGEVEKPGVPGKMAAKVVGRLVTAKRKGEKVKWTSWANIAAGVKAAEESSSSGSEVPILITPNGSESPEAKLSPSNEQDVADSLTEDPGPHIRPYDLPLIGSAIPRPITKPGFWLPPISGLDLSSPTAATPTASKLPLPTWSPHASPGLRPPPGFSALPAQSGGKAPAWSTFSGRTKGLNMPADTTTYIRERHCAGCSLCDLLKSRKVYE